MGRDRLDEETLGEIADALYDAQPMDHYHQLAKAVAAVVEPLLAEKDKAAVEVVERLLRATMDNPDAGDLHLARHKAREFLAGRAVSGVGSTGVVPSEGADQLASPGPVVTGEERAALRSACSKCGGLVRLELRCEACGDLPAVEGAESWTEWRVTQSRSGVQTIWFQLRESLERLCSQWKDRGPLLIEERTCWASRPVRVEEQGE